MNADLKTTDGGRAWKQVLKVDDDTGANDLVMDPGDGKVLYASTYQRRRTACCMNSGGPGSGIWKSTDGGDTWTRIKGACSISRWAASPRRLPASVQCSLRAHRGTVAAGRRARRRGSRRRSRGEEGPARRPRRRRIQPAVGRCGAAGGQQAVNPNDPTGFYRSDDAGATWRKVHNANPRPMYFSQVRIDPNDSEVASPRRVDLHQTLDGGKTMNTAAASRIHSDHHAIWINPMNSDHVLIGNDGGLAVSCDKAKRWAFLRICRSRLLPRERGQRDPAQRLRRPSGQLQLVRSECRAQLGWHRQPRVEDAPGRRRLRGAPGSDRLPHCLQRVAGRQHRARRPRDRRDDADPPAAGPGEPSLRWHWIRRSSSRRTIRR